MCHNIYTNPKVKFICEQSFLDEQSKFPQIETCDCQMH